MFAKCCARLYPSGFKTEVKALAVLAIPLVLTQLTMFMLGPVALIFSGHLGTEQLDAVALANSMINVFGISIGVGLSSACDTLFAQYYGSANKQYMGIVLQRSLLIITMSVLPCLAIHLNAERFLVLIGQDHNVARLTGIYLLYFLPGLIAYFIFISLCKYVQNQNIVIPNLIIGAASNGLNALLHYIFLYVMSLDIVGSALAQAISYIVMLILTLVYIFVSGVYKNTWSGWSWECLQEWGMFFRLAIFGLLMICIEWWSFEVGMFLAGNLGMVQLGANSVVFQLEVFAYMIPLGLGIAGSIRVGQFLGSGSSEGAKTACRVAITVIVIISLTTGLLLASLRDYLPHIFSEDPAVISLAATVLPILGVYMVFDGLNGVVGGILRGAGRQGIGAVIVFVGYLIGLTGGIPLMFLTDLGIIGLWIFLAAALCLDGLIYAVLLYKLDWDWEVKKALKRTGQDECSSDNTEKLALEETNSEKIGNEKNSLLKDPKTNLIRQLSNSYKNYTTDIKEEIQNIIPRKLVICRLVIFAVLLSVFLIGLLCRLLLPPLPADLDNHNVTNSSVKVNTIISTLLKSP